MYNCILQYPRLAPFRGGVFPVGSYNRIASTLRRLASGISGRRFGRFSWTADAVSSSRGAMTSWARLPSNAQPLGSRAQ